MGFLCKEVSLVHDVKLQSSVRIIWQSLISHRDDTFPVIILSSEMVTEVGELKY